MYNVFYMQGGETKTYLAEPVSKAEAYRQCEAFESKYYNKQYPNGRGRYNVSRPWVGADVRRRVR